jgi:ankyrin repeat protein
MKLAAISCFLACAPAVAQISSNLPSPAAIQVEFTRDVKPILQANCYSCHGRSQQLAGLRLDLRQTALRGGDSGEVIVPGRSAGSKLILRLVGSEAGLQMPPTGPISAEEIGVLRAWIDQGAPWTELSDLEVAPVQMAPPDLRGKPLFEALRRADRRTVRALIARDPSLLSVRDSADATPLMSAVLYGDVATVKALLERGADPNVRNAAGTSALMWAAGNEDMVRLLLARGADVNAKSQEGRTALLVAAGTRGSSAAVQLLLDRGAAPAARDVAGVTAIMRAAEAGDAATIEQLAKRGVDVNARASNGATALGAAATARCGACVDSLLSLGADPKIATKRGVTPLALAAMFGAGGIVKALLARGADPNACDDEGYTPLLRAVYSDFGTIDTVRALLDHGADATARSKRGETALALAGRHGETAVVKALVEAGAKE